MSWFVDQKDEKRLLDNLENPTVKFTDLLHNVAIYKLIRDRNFSTIKYLSNHIQEIIDTCFPLNYEKFNNKNNDWEDSSRTFLLFTKAPPLLLEALFTNDAIYTQISLIFMKIRNGLHPPFFLISRISSILAFIVSNIPNEVNNCIGFIYQLLPFKNEPGVFDLFEQICSSDPSFELMQKALIESHFPDHIIYEIKKRKEYLDRSNRKKYQNGNIDSDINKQTRKNNSDTANEANTQSSIIIDYTNLQDTYQENQNPDLQNNIENENANEITLNEFKCMSSIANNSKSNEILIDNTKFINNESMYFISEDDEPNHELHISLLLRIVSLCSTNQILKEIFCCNSTIETFYALIDSSNLILNELWNAILTMTNEKNESKMIIFLPKAVENVKEPYSTVLRYQVFSLDFIAKMTKLKSKGLSDTFMKQVQQVILRLIVQFPNSTNLIICIFRLIKYGIIYDEFSDQFIENFVPIMIIEASNDNKTAVQAKSKSLLWKLSTKTKFKSLKIRIAGKIDNYNEFSSSVLRTYNLIMNSSYGGDSQNLKKQSLFSPGYFIF